MAEEVWQVVHLCRVCSRWIDDHDNGHLQGCALAPAGTRTYLPPPTPEIRLGRYEAIVRRVAQMGLCSQTGHEHLARDARDLLEGK